MDFTWKEILTAVMGSGSIVVGLFVGIKFIYERLDMRQTKKKTVEEKAYDAVWKLYEAAKTEVTKLKQEIEELEKGDSLSRPTITNIHKAARKLARQMEIFESMLIREFGLLEDESEMDKGRIALKREMEIVWQKYDDLEKCLP